MVNWSEIGQIMPKFIVENPWLLTHNGQCSVDDVVSVTDELYGELATLRAENERLREALANLLKLAKTHAPNAGFPQAEEDLK